MRRTLTMLVAGVALAGCRASLELEPSDAPAVLGQQLLSAPDPGRPGSHGVRTFYYGSGTDLRRAEYRDSVTLRTETVDASRLVRLGDQAEERNAYWGFSPDSFPINGRVWAPEGAGPFPLVLVVHGNHDMKDFSDPGYDYLGELLASRGFILASVDMNFINGGIRDENDGRGWLLLKHLQAWRDFNERAGSPVRGQVDMSRIGIMGHSRGGEAVGHAAAFNRLTHYPDDASLEFDFGFDIRAVVAIAPVDGQYLPTGRKVPVRDVDYLVFHGSHDGDVTSFHGLRQYSRVEFTPGTDHFKSAVYVYRANHGQWNSVWGPRDNGPRSARILDLRGLLPTEQQMRFAEVYVSAFLEATLHDDDRYLPLFRDHRVAGEWLPPTMYFTSFEHSSFRPLVTFEEDIDVTTGTAPSVRLEGDSLQTWNEGDLELRSRNRANTSASQENQVVWLGWNRHVRGEAEALGRPSAYTVRLAPETRRALDFTERTTLDFRLGPSPDEPSPRSPPEGAGRAENREREETPAEDEEADEEPIDLSVEVVDEAGVRARVALSTYGPLRRPLETHVMRRRDQERERFPRMWELVLQSFSIPLADFRAVAPDLDLIRIAEIRFVFDRTEAGTVALDDVGFSNLPPAFLEPRMPPRVAGSGERR